MIDEKLLNILSCPISHTPLTSADEETIARLNRAIEAGQLKDRSGQRVEKPLEGGLIPSDGSVVYPVLDGIPVLLPNEAIPLSQIQ